MKATVQRLLTAVLTLLLLPIPVMASGSAGEETAVFHRGSPVVVAAVLAVSLVLVVGAAAIESRKNK